MNLVISPQVIEGYKRLNYTYWHALAELVDNSTYWYELNRDLILKYDSEATQCEVRITYDASTSILRVADNSIGMDLETLTAAMVIGKKSNRPGRSVYGMGLKTACIWMGDKFTIKTKMAGQTSGYEVTVDYNEIMKGNFQLGFKELKNLKKEEHFTVVEIAQLGEAIQRKRVSKIKEYLMSIYREDFREGKLNLTFNEEKLEWSDSANYIFLKDQSGADYKRDFKFDINGKEVKGWVGIMSLGGVRRGGLTILQNKRVIRGAPDAWKPEGLFGETGEGLTTSLASQRLVGEIHMDGFGVTHTKDNIAWSKNEEILLTEALEKEFDDFRKVAAQFRKTKHDKPEFSEIELQEAIEAVKEVTESPEFKDVVTMIPETTHSDPKLTDSIHVEKISRVIAEGKANFETKVGSIVVKVFLTQGSQNDIYLDYESDASGKVINMTINLRHPYLTVTDPAIHQYILSCIYDAVAEYHCNKQTSVVHARTIRLIKNDLMRTSINMSENAN